MRIFTDINVSKERGDYHLEDLLQASIFGKSAPLREIENLKLPG
jgi:hypothetical protein